MLKVVNKEEGGPRVWNCNMNIVRVNWSSSKEYNYSYMCGNIYIVSPQQWWDILCDDCGSYLQL